MGRDRLTQSREEQETGGIEGKGTVEGEGVGGGGGGRQRETGEWWG